MLVNWKPHPGPQLNALTRTEFEILYGGARGGGKTDAGLAWLTRHIDNPLYRALIIRRNADDLSDWILRAREMYRNLGASFAYRPAVITFPSGAVFKTGHLKDENAYGKYLGHEYQRMVIEELNQIPNEELYLKLISSCRSTIDIRPQVFCTTNPGGIGHAWVKARFVQITDEEGTMVHSEPNKTYKDKHDKTRIFIPSKVYDNPTILEKNPEYVDFLKGLPETLRRAWLEGDWDIVAGQVFSEFRADTHVVEPFEIPKGWTRYMAMDWGVNAPFSVGWYAVNEEGRTYLYRELYMNGIGFQKKYGKQLTAYRLARVLQNINWQSQEDYDYMVCDPSMWTRALGGKVKQGEVEGESVAEIMLNTGMKLTKGDNNRENGLAKYREVLSTAPDGKPWYQIFSTCRDTIRTIPSLPYDERKVEDVDTNAEDHCYDRDRYLFMSRPALPTKPMKEKTLIQKNYDKYKKGIARGDADWWF